MPDTLTTNVATVTYDDGRVSEIDIARPLFVLQASKLAAENSIEAGFNLVWVAAGRPEGSLEAWLGTVRAVEFADDENPTPREPSE